MRTRIARLALCICGLLPALTACAPLHGGAGRSAVATITTTSSSATPEVTDAPTPSTPPTPVATATPSPEPPVIHSTPVPRPPTPAPTPLPTPVVPPAFATNGKMCTGCIHLFAAADGNLWTVAPGGCGIQQVTPPGATANYSWAGPPNGSGQPTCPGGTVKFGVTGPDGNLWITREIASSSTAEGEVDRITPGGAMTSFPVARPAPLGGASSASDNSGRVTVGPDRALWFTDFTDRMIGRITTSGSVTEYVVSASPEAIVRGPDGALWFNDSGVARLGRITTSGAVTYVSLPGSATDLTVGSDSNLWVSDGPGGEMLRVTARGSVTRYPVTGAIGQSPGPVWLVTGRDGNVWFTDSNNDAVGWIGPRGDAHEYQVPGQADQRSSWPAPDHLAVGLDGHVWFLEITMTLLTYYGYAADELFRVG